jgi:hypothetical protein
MSKFPLDLSALAPQEATFTLSGLPDKTLTLCKWTLRVRAWAFEKYGAKELQKIFAEHRILPLSEIAFFMLKEKDAFKSFDDFQDAVSTTQDYLAITKAILKSVGIGEPEIEKINDDLEKKAKANPDPNPTSPKNP